MRLGKTNVWLKLQRNSSEEIQQRRNPGGVKDFRERLFEAIKTPYRNGDTKAKARKVAAAGCRMVKKGVASAEDAGSETRNSSS